MHTYMRAYIDLYVIGVFAKTILINFENCILAIPRVVAAESCERSEPTTCQSYAGCAPSRPDNPQPSK